MANPAKMTKKDRQYIVRAMSLMSQVAFTAAACVFIGVFVGRFLDDRLGTSPWLLLVFALLGAASSFKAMIDVAKKL